MISQARHKRLYHLHSATGIWLGFFLYLVAITGCFAVFHSELQTWENPELRIAASDLRMDSDVRVDIDTVFAQWVADKARIAPLTFARLALPTPEKPFYHGLVGIQAEGVPVAFHTARWNMVTGAAVPPRGDGAVEWLYGMHRDLNWPEAWGGRRIGRALAGFAGIVLLLSIVSGVLIHRKIISELFSLRFYRSVRLRWQDSHKIIGVWGLPPFAVFAITGAFLGIITLLAPATAFLTVKGDQEALATAVAGEVTQPAGIAADMLLPSEAITLSPKGGAVGTPALLVYRHWGDMNAVVEVSYKTATDLSIYETYPYSAVTGDRLSRAGVMDTSRPAVAVIAAYSALHYGTYGGLALKILYFLIGLSLATMIAFGLMLWIERRLHGSAGAKSDLFYQWISHGVTGLVMGVPLATAITLGYDKVYTGSPEGRFAAMGSAYFATLLASMVYACLRRQDYRAARTLVMLTGTAFACLPAINMLVTDASPLDILSAGHRLSAYVDAVFLCVGLLVAGVGLRLPAKRSAPVARDHDAGVGLEKDSQAPDSLTAAAE